METYDEQLRKTWAFARKVRAGKRLRGKRHSIITACSYQAKLLGIRTGMRYEEAKSLVPEIKILVIGGRNV